MTDAWPHPSVWVSDLLEELKGLDQWFLTYEGLRSGRLRMSQDERDRLDIVEPIEPMIPHQYARVVSRVVEALEKLPPFANGDGLAALKALRIDLNSLDEGGLPDRLRPRRSASVGGDNPGRRMAKAHIVSFVLLLKELGLKDKPARELVVEIFNNNGLPITASSLFRWVGNVCGASPNDLDGPGKRLVDRKLTEWKADARWPLTIDQATAIINSAAAGTTISLAYTT